MDLFDLVAKLSLDSSDYESKLKDSKEKAGIIGSALGTAATVGAAAIGAATTAVAGFAKSSLAVGQTFDASMSQVAATMGNVDDIVGQDAEAMERLRKKASELGVSFDETTSATELSTATLRAFAQEMGAKTAFSATQAAEALNYMALAGYDAEKSMEMMSNVLNLAAAGNMDLARASDMVTDTQSALGLSLDETKELVDQMAKTASRSNTSVEQLGDAMLTIGATARGVKGGTVELSTVLGVLADNGIKASEGGTHLRNAILSLQTPTKDGTEALAKLGMSYEDMYDSAGNMRALPEIFLEMQGRMEGMTQASKDAIISGIFNKTDLASINALVGTSSERWSELTTEIENSTGAAEKMAGTQLDNVAGSITLLKSALEGAQILLSDQLTPTFKEFVKLATDSINKLADAFKADGLDGLMSALSEVMEDMIAKIVEVAPKFIEAGVGLLGAFANGVIKNIPSIAQLVVEGIRGILGQISEAVVGYDMFDDFASFIDGILDIFTGKIPDFVSKAGEWIAGFVSGISDSMPDIGDVMTLLVETIGTILEQWVPNMLEAGKNLMQNLVDGLKESDFEGMIGEVFTLIRETMANLIPTIIETVPELFNLLTEAATEALPMITEFVTQGFATLQEAITGLLPELIPTALNTLMTFSGALRENIGTIVDSGLELILALAQGIIDNLPVMLQTIPTIVINIAGIINDNLPKILAAGVKIIGKLVAGILQSVPTLIAEFPKIVQAIFAVITAFNWINLGANIINFIKNGIQGLATSIPTALKNIGKNALEWLKAIEWRTLGKDLIDLILIGIKSLVTAIPNAIKDIGMNALSAMKGIDWLDVGANIVAGISNGLFGAARELVDAAISVVSDAWNAVTGWLHISSPSKKARDVIGKNWALGIGVGFEEGMPEDDMLAAQQSAFEKLRKAQEGYEFPAIESTITSTGGASGTERMMQELFGLLSRYLPNMAKSQVYLYPSKRAYVADIAGDMNDALGEMARWEAVR